jgi:hypothetical protein
MYREGDKVRVKNDSAYHNWNVGVLAIVEVATETHVHLIAENIPNGYTYQTLGIGDVEFVSRTNYIEGDMVTVIGHSFSHDIPIGAIVKVDRIRRPGNELVIDVLVDEATGHRQGVSPESLAPIAFTSATQGFARLVNASTVSLVEPNDAVRVNIITDRPKCEDESLFTEFTSWQQPFTGASRSGSDGLVIDKNTVVTFLGTNSERDDIFSIRYEETSNIVIAKGKLNNGYAKYIS